MAIAAATVRNDCVSVVVLVGVACRQEPAASLRLSQAAFSLSRRRREPAASGAQSAFGFRLPQAAFSRRQQEPAASGAQAACSSPCRLS